MSTSVPVEEARVTFPNQLTSMAGILFTPANLDKTKTYPALAVAHPFGGVKEQTSGNYARKMAERVCCPRLRREPSGRKRRIPARHREPV